MKTRSEIQIDTVGHVLSNLEKSKDNMDKKLKKSFLMILRLAKDKNEKREAIRIASSLLEDEDTNVRKTATLLIKGFGKIDELPDLIRGLENEENPKNRYHLLTTIYYIVDMDARRVIAELKDGNIELAEKELEVIKKSLKMVGRVPKENPFLEKWINEIEKILKAAVEVIGDAIIEKKEKMKK